MKMFTVIAALAYAATTAAVVDMPEGECMAPEPSPCYKESNQNENSCNMVDGCKWSSGENQGSTDMPTDEPGSGTCVEQGCSDQQNENDCEMFQTHDGDMCEWDDMMNMCAFKFTDGTTTTTSTDAQTSECYAQEMNNRQTCEANDKCYWLSIEGKIDLEPDIESCEEKTCYTMGSQTTCENFDEDCEWGTRDGKTACFIKDDLISDTTTTTEMPGGGDTDGDECYALEIDSQIKCENVPGCVWEEYNSPTDSTGTDLPGGSGSCLPESCSTQKSKTTCENYDDDCEWDAIGEYCSEKGSFDSVTDGITDGGSSSGSGTDNTGSGSGGDPLTDPPPGPCDGFENDETGCTMKTECEWLKFDTNDDTPGDVDGYCVEISCTSQQTSMKCQQFNNGQCKWVTGENGEDDYCVDKDDDVSPTDMDMSTTDDTLGNVDCTKYNQKNMCEQNGCVFKPYSTKMMTTKMMTTKMMTTKMATTKSMTPGACPSGKYDARGVWPNGTAYQRCVGSISCRANSIQFGKLKGAKCKCEDKANCFYCKRTANGDECLRCKKYTYLSDGKCVTECPAAGSHVGVGGYGRYCSPGPFTCSSFKSSIGGPPCKCSNTNTRPNNRASPCAVCEFEAGKQGEKCMMCKKSMYLHWDTYTCHEDCQGQSNKVAYAAGSYARECRDAFMCTNGQDTTGKKCKCTGKAGKKNCFQCSWGLDQNGDTVNKCEICWKNTYKHGITCVPECPSGYQAVEGTNGKGGECQKV